MGVMDAVKPATSVGNGASAKLILASASPRRQALLREMLPHFDVTACQRAEPQHKPAGLSALAWVQALAYYKARGVAEAQPGRWVLGADTIVVCGESLLGKPADEADAARMLALQAGRPSVVITGVCLMRMGGTVQRLFLVDSTRVWMRADPQEVAAYLRSGDWQGKAGAYGIQDVGDRLVERIEGSFSNVVGLPVERLAHVLRRARILT
jgi:septum formation protein